jgi:Tfp pilus assembly protein PilN
VTDFPTESHDGFEFAQPPSGRRTTLILWLVVVGMGLLIVPLYLFSLTLDADNDELLAELQPLELTMTSLATPAPEVELLQPTLAYLQTSRGEIETVKTTLAVRRTDWQAVMRAIGSYDPEQLTLESVSQSGNQVTLNGRAVDDAAVVAYANNLEAAQLFSNVVIESILIVATPPPSPTATAPGGADRTPTATPGGGVTPTSEPRDKYEVDDFEPRPIFMGETQAHNFYPIHDVDTVTFLAKAGRFYRVATSGLEPGVDTFLSVQVGQSLYNNDDRQPGELASEVFFQMDAGHDQEVTVKVSNRAFYGPDKWYQLTVEEVIPSPTPTETGTPMPSVTGTSPPTPIPSATPIPPSPPTATPDLRDRFEPDDDSPKPIAVGETQTHNFYPFGDVDSAYVGLKSGRLYRVLTSELALGVDTFLRVVLGDQQWENDDYDVPGSGSFGSLVCFESPWDDTAVVTVLNRTDQFGPDKRYNLSITEAPILDVFPTTVDFGSVILGESAPPAQSVVVSSVGAETVSWIAEPDQSWLVVSPLSGSGPAQVLISASTAGLPAGTYQGSVQISATTSCTQNGSQTITANLQIVAPVSRAPGLASDARFPGGLRTSGGQGLMSSRSRAQGWRGADQASVYTVEFVLVLGLR